MKKTAKGVSGYLIWCIDGVFRFRVYDDKKEFVDYDITHGDLAITITDDDATLYSDACGDRLDYTLER